MAADSELEDELKQAIGGEVRFDAYSRALYSTDASIFQIEPIGVVIPRDAADVAAALKITARHHAPVLPRGGGTSLAGQAVGCAVIIDFSKYMNRVLDINIEECRARVQPGVILDELNRGLRPHGLHFAPDTRAFHGHCHLKALVGSGPSLQMLRSVPDLVVEEVDSGCCGMAGSFGYEKEHYDISIAIAERRLAPAVRAFPSDAAVVAGGISCRQQIAHTTGRHALHPAEVLAQALPSEPRL